MKKSTRVTPNVFFVKLSNGEEYGPLPIAFLETYESLYGTNSLASFSFKRLDGKTLKRAKRYE